jgi:hypothetical protein
MKVSFVNCTTVALLLVLLPLLSVSAQTGDSGTYNRAHGPNFDVNVSAVKPVQLRQPTGVVTQYQITYKYEFKERSSVYIKGLGQAAPKGDFKYVFSKLELEFRSSSGGELLALVPLKVTVVAAAPPVEVPQESDFSQDFFSGIWASHKTFPEQVTQVLQSHSSIRVFAVDNVSEYITRYMPLTGLTSGTFAEVAVLVSHPFDQAGGRFSYRVRYLGREKRTLTPWRELSPALRQQAEDFVRRLISEINAASR